MSEVLPAPVSARVRRTVPEQGEVREVPVGELVVRVHPLGGPHPLPWDGFRSFGPTSSRFDHHPPPPKEHPRRRIAYGAVGDDAFTTVLAEYFQDASGGVAPIDRRLHTPAVSAFRLARPIRLLDLRSGWLTRAGGNQAITSGPRWRAREWAQVIHRVHTDVDGLLWASSVWAPGECVALWERAQRAMPPEPELHRLMSDPVLDVPLAHAARTLGTVALQW